MRAKATPSIFPFLARSRGRRWKARIVIYAMLTLAATVEYIFVRSLTSVTTAVRERDLVALKARLDEHPDHIDELTSYPGGDPLIPIMAPIDHAAHDNWGPGVRELLLRGGLIGPNPRLQGGSVMYPQGLAARDPTGKPSILLVVAELKQLGEFEWVVRNYLDDKLMPKPLAARLRTLLDPAPALPQPPAITPSPSPPP
jgi:hypothetical protein